MHDIPQPTMVRLFREPSQARWAWLFLLAGAYFAYRALALGFPHDYWLAGALCCGGGAELLPREQRYAAGGLRVAGLAALVVFVILFSF